MHQTLKKTAPVVLLKINQENGLETHHFNDDNNLGNSDSESSLVGPCGFGSKIHMIEDDRSHTSHECI